MGEHLADAGSCGMPSGSRDRLKLPRNLLEANSCHPPLRDVHEDTLPAGDVSRKRKLLEKQKEGKKRMRQIGSVEVPQEVFHALMRSGKS